MSARPGPSGGYHASDIPTGISPPELASQDTGRVTANRTLSDQTSGKSPMSELPNNSDTILFVDTWAF